MAGYWGAWHASALPRWIKNLHRSLLLGDAGRWGAAGIALTMGVLCVSALVLLVRRMGGEVQGELGAEGPADEDAARGQLRQPMG